MPIETFADFEQDRVSNSGSILAVVTAVVYQSQDC